MRQKKNLGLGFADELTKITLKDGHFKKPLDKDWKDVLLPNFDPSTEEMQEKGQWQTVLFFIATLVFFFVIFVRLFHLQIVQGKQNRELADGNRIHVKKIYAPRGVIFDRNGKVLAANSPGFRLVDKETKRSKFITREEALELEVRNDPRALDLEVDSIRSYPLEEKTAHLVGFVGEISQEQLNNQQFKEYSLGDRVGQSGIEAYYENILRGKDGGEIIEVDSTGKKIRTLRRNTPIPGQNIYLTIDADLQVQIYDRLKEISESVKSCCAAAIAQDPTNGQVLALVSLPSFSPNSFTKERNDAAIAELFSRADSPILNRVITGTYPPGSTYKIVSSIAALASGKITPQTQIEDTGEIFLGPFRFTNWYFTQYGRTDGPVNLVKALKRSNDTYYYRVGETIGEQVLIDWSRSLYLGKRLGIDLPGEETGLVPDNEWKVNNIGQPWYPGDTLHLSIGQGFLLTTPLQVSGLISFIANDGRLYRPQLALKVTFEDKIMSKFEPQLLVSDLVSKDYINVVKKGLEEVTQDGGTAWPFLNFPIQTAGKTGTSEFGHPQNKTHAWYTSYAPVSDPKIALTVLVEAGGEGSSVGGSVSKEIYRWYFSEDKTNLIKDIYQVPESAKALGE